MKKELDCRALACPSPVIMTKKEIEGMDQGQLLVKVGNEAAKENVSRLAGNMNLPFTVDHVDGENYDIIIDVVDNLEVESEVQLEGPSKRTIAISSSKMGSGSDELGNILMKSFIYTVRETEPYPETILFYNEGVLLTTEGSEVLEDIIYLEEQGVEICSCGTCLDFYNLKDKLRVGIVSNMYDIYEKMRNANTLNID